MSVNAFIFMFTSLGILFYVMYNLLIVYPRQGYFTFFNKTIRLKQPRNIDE